MPDLGLPPPPWIVGHRGTSDAVPENTVESLRQAVAQKADMVELDLQLTRDGELVVHHDLAISISEKERRPVGHMTLEEVKRCRPVWKREGQALAYEIPTLGEVLAAAPAELPLNLEIKRYDPGADPARLIETLAEAIAGRDRVLVSSFDRPVLAEIRRRMPELPLAPLGGRTAEWAELVELGRRLDAFSIHIHRSLAASLGRRGELEPPAAKERPILAYTVNTVPEARRLLRLGVSGLFTDRPGELRDRLGRRA